MNGPRESATGDATTNRASENHGDSVDWSPAGCLFVLGGALLLVCVFVWQMAWGFAGEETHFCGGFHLTPTHSREELIICPLERLAAGLSILFLAAGCCFGLGFLLKYRKYSLQRLVAAALLAAAVGAYPFFALSFLPPATRGTLETYFESKLDPPQIQALRDRLSVASVAAWRPAKEGLLVRPPTEAELAQAGYVAEVSEQKVLIMFSFAGSSFSRRNEIREFYVAFLEEQMASLAEEAGFAPVRSEDRTVRYERREK